MKTTDYGLNDEDDAELTEVPRFDEGAKEAARPVVPLSHTKSTDSYSEHARAARGRAGTWPRGLFLALGLVLAASTLAAALFYQDESTPPPAVAAEAAPAETTPAAHLAIAETAAGVVPEAEAVSEPATSDSDDVTDEQTAQPERPRARRVSTSRYVTGRLGRDEKQVRKLNDQWYKEEKKRLDLAHKEAKERLERARKEAEKRAERRRKREKERARSPRLVGRYTLRSRH